MPLALQWKVGLKATRSFSCFTNVLGALAKQKWFAVNHWNQPVDLILGAKCRTLNPTNGNFVRGITYECRRYFRTTDRRNIPPLLLVIFRPLTKIGAALVGRGIRKWWQSLPPNKKKYVWQQISYHKGKIILGTGIMSGCGVLFYFNHLEAAPISKRERFLLFNPDQYEPVSKELFQMHIESHRENILPTSHQAYKFVSTVVDRLLLGNRDLEQIYNKTWSITIVNKPEPNAFVLPSGQIFVFTGMLTLCDNPDQLACIMGHELAHAVLGHSAEILSYGQLIDVIMMFVLAIIWTVLPNDITSVLGHWLATKISSVCLELPYSRMLETEADEVGLELAAKACFDIRESTVFWRKMTAIKDYDSEIDIEWLSTHPIHEKRAETLDSVIPKALDIRKSCKCPPLSSKDPRTFIKSYKEWIENERKKELSQFALFMKLPKREVTTPELVASAIIK